ncbi:hypothetical protein D3C75_653500 [compost metagenome]
MNIRMPNHTTALKTGKNVTYSTDQVSPSKNFLHFIIINILWIKTLIFVIFIIFAMTGKRLN